MDLTSEPKGRTFRASIRRARGNKWLWLLQVLDWRLFLRLESGTPYLLLSSKTSYYGRTVLLVVAWSFLAVGYLIPFKYFTRQLADAIYDLLSGLGLTGFERLVPFILSYITASLSLIIIFWYVGTYGILCLLDQLTLRLQAHYTTRIAILELKDTHLGILRHGIMVRIVEVTDQILSSHPTSDYLRLIVIARRGTIAAASVPPSGQPFNQPG